MLTEMPSDPPAKWLSLPVIAAIARILCRALTLQNEHLRLENKILKSKIKGRIRLIDDERRALVDAALAMGRKLRKSVVNIVKPATLLTWQRRLEKLKSDYSERRNRKPGRPPCFLAKARTGARKNIWGYKRIHGELKKLNITISKTCIANILRRNGLPPSPESKGLTWKEFLSRHTEVFLCADLLTKEISWLIIALSGSLGFRGAHLLLAKNNRGLY
ncbi:MAG: hypothetical protein ACETWQ_20700 [Phycisphaerae bacterium]